MFNQFLTSTLSNLEIESIQYGSNFPFFLTYFFFLLCNTMFVVVCCRLYSAL